MPKVVSNTTPIISLLKVNRLEILRQLYGHIHIPLAVYNEIEAGKNKDYYCDLTAVDWITVSAIKNTASLAHFLDLDSGEAEAIVLAMELKADVLIIDEALGRFYAKNAGLKITGTIGVLVKAKTLGIITDVHPLLNELRDKGVWISEKLKQEILILVGEE